MLQSPYRMAKKTINMSNRLDLTRYFNIQQKYIMLCHQYTATSACNVHVHYTTIEDESELGISRA